VGIPLWSSRLYTLLVDEVTPDRHFESLIMLYTGLQYGIVCVSFICHFLMLLHDPAVSPLLVLTDAGYKQSLQGLLLLYSITTGSTHCPSPSQPLRPYRPHHQQYVAHSRHPENGRPQLRPFLSSYSPIQYMLVWDANRHVTHLESSTQSNLTPVFQPP